MEASLNMEKDVVVAATTTSISSTLKRSSTTVVQQETKRRMERIPRNCLSLSTWSSISGNVAPVFLSSLQPRLDENEQAQRSDSVVSTSSSSSSSSATSSPDKHLSLAQKILQGSTSALNLLKQEGRNVTKRQPRTVSYRKKC